MKQTVLLEIVTDSQASHSNKDSETKKAKSDDIENDDHRKPGTCRASGKNNDNREQGPEDVDSAPNDLEKCNLQNKVLVGIHHVWKNKKRKGEKREKKSKKAKSYEKSQGQKP